MSAIKAPFHTRDVQIDEDVQFEALITNSTLLRGVSEAGYERPSPIQLKAIPPGKLGLDVIAQAKSGTGKTIVFSIVALETVNLNVNKPQVLILSPTRELAIQTHKVILSIGRHMLGLNAHVFIGGMPVESDWPKLRKCHIVIGSPGRVELLLNQNKLNAKEIKLLVLDEADKLMEKSFRPQMQRLCNKLNEKKQVMAFSATYDKHLLNTLYRNYMKNPHQVMLTESRPTSNAILPDDQDKYKFYEEKFKSLAALLGGVPFYQCIVFLNHRGRAADLADYLTKQGWMSMNISGGLDQKTRLTTMNKVRNFQLRVLICSDLIARGIDIDRVDLVVNLDIPKDPETYLHRVGRTGRYGTHGLAISFVDEKEMGFINILQKEYSVEVKPLPEELSNEHHQRPLITIKDQRAFERLEAIRNKVQMKGEEIPVIFTDEKVSGREVESNGENKGFKENEYLGNNLQFQTDYNYNNHNYHDDAGNYWIWDGNASSLEECKWMYITHYSDQEENAALSLD
ncbi:5468_t:CDS:10 [Ambispora gerdemannii]|uniref:RNA helicase n=1 Tax=Ambispora gerdemannii TaxID=144530 RepID=A0A9N9B7S7_9GLOM|nr:5468_t:CDS:10 [Ambispora gerdemannii]